ncbi:unnamed protein product [Angiostrongylus costaricensis]|uniref:Calcium uniporter protein n=1 Tax=Angiostrongylus costaricensis TaxID=334426 RepID=A0A0R3PRV5_ANGCS|nr:unnamed protein product [Angiostrongylus costaricensis]
MLLTPANWAARKREDRRPLYRRIFTNRRLDILHKTFIRSILGFILFSTSYCIVNTGIYYKFVRPIRKEERELLERELIEADRAGFAINLKLMIASGIIASFCSRWEGIFLMGFVSGAGFELFKIYFSFRGVNYYSVFKKKQLQKELDKFEKTLKELDDVIAQGVPRAL